MITANQILAHLVGDYILQSDWMAQEKTRRNLAAAVHGWVYSLPFLFFEPSLSAWLFIFVSHAVIDRWRLARYVCYAKNWMGPHGYFPWKACSSTGYIDGRPAWLTTWLLIIADNTLHLICNGIALRYL